MEKNEIKKLLYKQQPKAKFIRIKSNHAYYGTFVELEDKTMQQVIFDIPISDLGDAELWVNEEAKLLIRYLTVVSNDKVEPACLHPIEDRSYIGEGHLKCGICGEEFK